MIDIHTHILPSVDDGSSSIEESLAMLKIAQMEGISSVFLTPHYISDANPSNREKNKVIFDQLKSRAREEKLKVDLYLGNEVFLTDEIGDLLKSGEVSSLGDSRYVLVEFARHAIPLHIEEIIYRLRLDGYIPVIAHPERYREVLEDPNVLIPLIEKGALCQLNLASVRGRYGDEVRNCAKILLEHDMVHFFGTDAHSSSRFRPVVGDAIDEIEKFLPSEKIDFLASKNPQAIIEDRVIEVDDPKSYKPSKFKKVMDFIRGF